jgi:hypothetical protein
VNLPRVRTHFRRWFRPPRRFRLTREGKWFIGATLVLGFAAVNGGINLLFLIFGMLLCLLLANGVLSEACLRHLVVTRRLPAAIHAKTPFLVGIAVRNAKKRIPTFSLEVEDMVANKPVDRRCFYLKVPAGREQETAYRRTLPRRGIHRLSACVCPRAFPSGCCAGRWMWTLRPSCWSTRPWCPRRTRCCIRAGRAERATVDHPHPSGRIRKPARVPTRRRSA